MKNKFEENVILNSIIDELRKFEHKDMYQCPNCDLYFSWDDVDYNPEEGIYICPHCKEIIQEEDLQSVNLIDYIEDVFMTYKGEYKDE